LICSDECFCREKMCWYQKMEAQCAASKLCYFNSSVIIVSLLLSFSCCFYISHIRQFLWRISVYVMHTYMPTEMHLCYMVVN